MLIVEFSVDSPILVEALGQCPGTRIVHEEQYQHGDDIRYLFWVEGDDLTAFDEALADDPTVTDPVVLTDIPTRRLYRVDFTERGKEVATFPSWSEWNIVLLHSTATHEGWNVRMGMPDREVIVEYRQLCEDQGLSFELKSLYAEEQITEDGGAANRYGVTPAQSEALLAALDMGYFGVPRQTTLAEIADELEVSSQAVSARLRRGQESLLRHTLAH